MTCFQSSLGYHTWEILRRFSSTLCRFFALPADFLQHLQIFCNTLQIYFKTSRFSATFCRISTESALTISRWVSCLQKVFS